MQRGFLLGKFMPPHAGHLFLCEVARARVDQLTVLLCSHDAEPIPGDLRAEWMADSLRGLDVRLRHMHRDIPQEPTDHPDFWAIWKAAIAEYHPEPIDWVFGSETYVQPLAETLGAKAFVVDLQRRAVPVSATLIRTDPAAHWPHVPPAVRPYFQRRITLLGPESAGKSTLAENLANLFGGALIPEYGRDYDALFRGGQGWSPADFMAIAQGHLALAGPIARNAGQVLIEDTDPLQTLVWAEYLLGDAPPDLVALVERMRLPNLYLLLGPQVEWRDDGTRHSGDPQVRGWFRDRLAHWLDRLGARWVHIDAASWDARQAQAMAALDQRPAFR